MHQNITKVAERGERLDALQDKTGALNCLERYAWCHLRSTPNVNSQTTSLSRHRDSAAEPALSGRRCGEFGCRRDVDAETHSPFRWKDMKMRIIIGVGICILIVIIVVPIVKT